MRDKTTYMNHIKVTSKSNQMQFLCAYNAFHGLEEMITSEPDEEELYDHLQNWINTLNKNPRTIQTYFSQIKKYLHYRGIKMNPLDIRQCLNFPTKYEEDLHPLGIDEIQQILTECDKKRRAMYLTQLSSGMRIGEIVQLRRKDIRMNMGRMTIKIPSWMTKRRRGRTTFVSVEAAKLLLPLIMDLDDDDLVFGTAQNVSASRMAEIMYLHRLLEKNKLNQKYETNSRNQITTHSFRAFFITRVSRHDANLAKYFAGQKGYLMQYDRLTDEEKLESYMKFETSLLIYGGTKDRERIQKLEDDLVQVKDLKMENDNLRRRMANLEEYVFDKYLYDSIKGEPMASRKKVPSKFVAGNIRHSRE